MSRLGFKCVVYHGDAHLGELEAVPVKDGNFRFPNNEIRIHHISPISERCHPLSVLQTISYSSVRCKLEPAVNSNSTSNPEQAPLINLHASCFYELKTAVVLLGSEEIHLVAMPSKQKKFPCFWCYSVSCGLYNSCLWMLNTRCLAIVFDLDETLIVANTMKSFEDRIDTLVGWIQRETDPIRESGMTAEMKRRIEDRALLKQYAESDCVMDGVKTYQVKQEEVPLLSDGNHRVMRPVVRLPEKNIILTRINPENRDTSVLVRLRPAWEDLKNYLTAKGRKRFEVFVCTMAERDYALEMWRLLDPEAHLISPKQLLDRVVCVKSAGAKKSLKSLNNVFQSGNCHPKMAMVIDDRLEVWEDKDQPRVHVVPAFTPYHAPQAETANAVPVLCVARNVACNVRGGFFKEFDENLLRRISNIFYEDEVVNLPCAPDVSNYLISEDASFIPNGIPNAPTAEGMHGPEVAQRLQSLEERNAMNSVSYPMANNIELKPKISKLPVASVAGPAPMEVLLPSDKPSLLGDPLRRDIRFSVLADKPLLSKMPRQTMQHGGWLVEENSSRGNINRAPGIISELDTSDKMMGRQNSINHGTSTIISELDTSDKMRGRQNSINHGTSTIISELDTSDNMRGRLNSINHGTSTSVPAEPPHDSQIKNEEAKPVSDTSRQNLLPPSELSIPNSQSLSTNRDVKSEPDKMNQLQSLSVGVLQEIGKRCKSKVDFRPVPSTSDDLQFYFEVYFSGEKIGVGMGKTRKDALQQAAENALRSLADSYISCVESRTPPAADNNFDRLVVDNEPGFIWEIEKPGSEEPYVSNGFTKQHSSEVGTSGNTNLG